MIDAVRAAPDDVELRLVYADWLMSRGDPRGELIVAQHRADNATADALLARHAQHFYGRWERDLYDMKWELGFLRSCRFAASAPDPAHEPDLQELLVHQSAALLRGFHLETVSEELNDLTGGIAAIARLAPPTLASLTLGHDGPYGPETVIGETRALGRLPLRELAIRHHQGPRISFSGLALPDLRSLVVRSSANEPSMIEELLACRWPALEQLELAACHTHTGMLWEPLLSGGAVPALRHLTWTLYGCLEWHAEAIATSPLLAQLHTLDLSQGILTEPAARVFVAHRERFIHLRRLVVLAAPGAETIATLGPAVELR